MYTDLPQTDDYLSLFLNDINFLDVRAPVEYELGAFPLAQNFPLINDQERHAIGLRYKNQGQDEAIKLGHQLVQGEIKEQRIKHWQNFFQQYPNAVLYCFRGGMRSKLSQQLIYETTGTVYPRVKGGYKAMRRFLINELEQSAHTIKPVMLGGRTGIGKTILLQMFSQQIDLEGLFHHRGSVFGKHVTLQPSQINIENQLSIALLKHRHKQNMQLVFEDEAANIGSRRIPEVLFDQMKKSPLILLEASVESRVNITYAEYIVEALSEHQVIYGDEQGYRLWAAQLDESIDKIQRRLGGARHQQLKSILTDALHEQRLTGDSEQFKILIEHLLVDYYDPMYDYQTSKKQSRVVFKGQQEEVLDFLESNYQIT